MLNSPNTPHSLRIVIFFLRLVLGANFFYLGWSVLFNRALATELRARTFSNLYAWLATPMTQAWLPLTAKWAFLIIGTCIILGLATRIASAIGIILAVLSYLATVSPVALDPSQFLSDQIIIIICLLILFVSNAGTYLGFDKFIHIHLGRKKG